MRCLVNPLLLPYRAWRYGFLKGGWFLPHLSRERGRRQAPDSDSITDVIVAIVDHFEPTSRRGDAAAEDSVAEWCDAYETVARNFRDSDGVMPQHTWFYRAEYPNFGCVRRLSQSCYHGYGEIEFHLHHGFDSHESFSNKLVAGLGFFNQVGAMVTAESQPRQLFSYIAGNWALDNGARDNSKSGCNTELKALKDAGCYADFTFPAIGSPAQPRMTNAIYYATDTPAPKSYDTGTPIEVGRSSTGDLLIFSGPLYVNLWRGIVDDGAIESFAIPLPERIDRWQRAHVHVLGRPEWMFVKLHCHGMQSKNIFRGDVLYNHFAAVTQKWKTTSVRLHFVTAREAYNIARAAEAGRSGNAGHHRDFTIPRPANRFIYCTQPFRLLTWSPSQVSIVVHGSEKISVSLTLATDLELFLESAAGEVTLQVVRDEHGIEVFGSREVRASCSQPSVQIRTAVKEFV